MGESSGDNFRATISGDVSGQVAFGTGNVQTQVKQTGPAEVTEADLEELRREIAALKQRVKDESPPEQQGPALERLDELEQAVISDAPNLTTMQYVKQWFAKNLPTLAESVASVVVHPIVGKLVGAAGDALAGEFRQRFGSDS